MAPAPPTEAEAAPAAPPAEAPPSLPAPPPAEGQAAPAKEPIFANPKIDLDTSPPPAPVVRKLRMHDGFYARLNLGFNLGSAFVQTDSLSNPNYTVGGGSIAIDLLLGGTPSPGLVIGGGLLMQGTVTEDVEIDGGRSSPSGSSTLTLIGPFVDGFPTPNKGLHFGGLVGLASARTTRQDNIDEFDGGGAGLAVWLGHDFWVGDEWSLGGLLRFSAAMTRQTEGEGADEVVLQNTTYGFTLEFSALYH